MLDGRSFAYAKLAKSGRPVELHVRRAAHRFPVLQCRNERRVVDRVAASLNGLCRTCRLPDRDRKITPSIAAVVPT